MIVLLSKDQDDEQTTRELLALAYQKQTRDSQYKIYPQIKQTTFQTGHTLSL